MGEPATSPFLSSISRFPDSLFQLQAPVVGNWGVFGSVPRAPGPVSGLWVLSPSWMRNFELRRLKLPQLRTSHCLRLRNALC